MTSIVVSSAVKQACREAAAVVAEVVPIIVPVSTGIDAIYDNAPSYYAIHSTREVQILNSVILEDPAFAALSASEDSAGLVVTTESLGFGISPENVAYALLSSAARSVYFCNQGRVSAGKLAETALEYCTRLARALSERWIELDRVQGLTGVVVTGPLETPWGTVIPAPPIADGAVFQQRNSSVTSALLITTVDEQVSFGERDYSKIDDEAQLLGLKARATSRWLIQLSFALGAPEAVLFAPEFTFTTQIAPFATGHGASGGRTMDRLSGSLEVTASVGRDIQRLSKVIDHSYTDKLAVPARRLISSINGFRDLSDSLIDAVMVWESLVGTNGETVFRVTAALAHLLESEPQSREVFRKKLANVYHTRSRLVHGEDVDEKTIAGHREIAVRVAIDALREILQRGPAWSGLTSAERSTRLLVTG